MSLNKLFFDISSSRRGVKPSFEPAHVLKALMLLYENEPIGRTKLSKLLGIGVTSTRTLIRRLKDYKLILIDDVGGCILTEKGREIISMINEVVAKVENVSTIIEDDLKLAQSSYASVIRNGVDIINKIGIVNVRDKVIYYGAKAALIIFADEEHVYIPPDKTFNELKYRSLAKLKQFLHIAPGEAVVVAFADNAQIAEKALLNAIIELFL